MTVEVKTLPQGLVSLVPPTTLEERRAIAYTTLIVLGDTRLPLPSAQDLDHLDRQSTKNTFLEPVVYALTLSGVIMEQKISSVRNTLEIGSLRRMRGLLFHDFLQKEVSCRIAADRLKYLFEHKEPEGPAIPLIAPS